MEEPKGDVNLDTLAVMIKNGFDEVHQKFDEVHQEITDVRSDVAALREETQAGFASLDRRLDDLADKLGDHEVRITKLEEPVLS